MKNSRCPCVGRSRSTYNIEKLIRAVVVSGLLAADKLLNSAIEASMRLIASPTMVDYIMHMATASDTGDLMVPSKSTLHRARTIVDSGFMAWHRKRVVAPSPFIIFILCDSSPQAGKDWVITECRLVSKSRAVELFRAVQQLFETKEQQHPETDR